MFEPSETNFALPWGLVCMNDLVLLQTIRGYESLATVWTLKWSLSRVRHHMTLQTTGLLECFLAYRTGKAHLFFMTPFMLPQISSNIKPFAKTQILKIIFW